MPKALELSLDTMSPPPMPKAAQLSPPASEAASPEPARKPKRGREVKAEKIETKEPLQVRWPVAEVKAVKLAAIQLDFPTISDFMLTCFHAYMEAAPGGRK